MNRISFNAEMQRTRSNAEPFRVIRFFCATENIFFLRESLRSPRLCVSEANPLSKHS
jgi:hypothetical protein